MNMEQLAKEAGVSVSIVSKAFSGSREISEEKREHGGIMLASSTDFEPKCMEEMLTYSRFEEAGYEAMNHLFSLEKLPTAILAAYDNIAIGAIKNIQEHGLKIPEDISIIGMDDIKEAASLTVPLTSITTYNKDWCQVIVDTLFEQMKSCKSNTPQKH